MAAERFSMRQIREILRQKWLLNRTHRAICESVCVSSGAVSGLLARATVTGLDWARVQALDDAALEELLYTARRRARTSGPHPTQGTSTRSARGRA